jgi:hypothetical protein
VLNNTDDDDDEDNSSLESGDSETAQSHGIEGQSASLHSSGDHGPPLKSIMSTARQAQAAASKSKTPEVVVGYVPSTSRSVPRTSLGGISSSNTNQRSYSLKHSLESDDNDYLNAEEFEDNNEYDRVVHDVTSTRGRGGSSKPNNSASDSKGSTIVASATQQTRQEEPSSQEIERRKSVAMIMQRWSMNTVEEFEAAQTANMDSASFAPSTGRPVLEGGSDSAPRADKLPDQSASAVESSDRMQPTESMQSMDDVVALLNHNDTDTEVDDDVKYAESFEESSVLHLDNKQDDHHRNTSADDNVRMLKIWCSYLWSYLYVF